MVVIAVVWGLLWARAASAAPEADTYASEVAVDRPLLHADVGRKPVVLERPTDGGLTVEAWVRAPRGAWLTLEADDGTPLLAVRSAGGQLELALHGATWTAPAPPADGAWHHVAIGVSAGAPASLTVDGLRQPAEGPSGSLPPASAVRARRGVRDVAVYDRVLPRGRLHSHWLVHEGHLPPTADPRAQPVRLRPQSGRGIVDAVLYAPDGNLVAVRRTTSVQVWDAQSRRLLHQLDSAHEIHDLVWAPEGRRLAVGTCALADDTSLCMENQIELLDVGSGEVRAIPAFLGGWIDRIRFSTDGTRLAATGNYQLKTWRAGSGELEQHQEVYAMRPTALAVGGGPAGELVAVGGEHEVQVFAGIEPAAQLKFRGEDVLRLAFLDADRLLLQSDQFVRVVDWRSGETVHEQPGRWVTTRLDRHGQVHTLDLDGRLGRLDAATGERGPWAYDQIPLGRIVPWRSLAPSPDARLLAVAHGASVRLLEPDAARVRADLRVGADGALDIQALDWSPDGRTLVVGGNDGALRFVDARAERVQQVVSSRLARPLKVALSPDGRRVATWSSDGIRVLDVEALRQRPRLPSPWPDDEVRYSLPWISLAFTDEGLLLHDADKQRGHLVDLDGGPGRAREMEEAPGIDEGPLSRSADGQRWLVEMEQDVLWVVDGVASMEEAYALDAPSLELDLRALGVVADPGEDGSGEAYLQGGEAQLTPDGSRVLLGVGRTRRSEFLVPESWIEVRDATDGRLLHELGPHPIWFDSLRVAEDGRTLIVRQKAMGGNRDTQLTLWDLERGERLLDTNDGAFGTDVAATADAQWIAKTTPDGRVRILDRARGVEITWVSGDAEWVVYGPDAVFTGSANADGLVAATRGPHAFGVDQLALTHNRPHELLARVQSEDQALRDHLAGRYARRLRQAGVEASEVAAQAPRPEVRIRQVTEPDDAGQVFVEVEALDDEGLAELTLFAQDVPLLKVPLTGTRVRERRAIRLTPGANKIEASVRNRAGQESVRALAEVSHQPDEPRTPTLYALLLGVSDYRDDALDLDWAHADAQDLGEALRDLPGFDTDVRVRTDADVTREVLDEAAAWLADAEPDDVFMLFVAGHGVHDEAGDYYFLTHEADLGALASTAPTFEQIEALLATIAPRQKLFLMDTCQSGEQDPTDGSGPAVASAAPTARGARAIQRFEEQLEEERRFVLPRERFVYADLRRRSGTIVLSSSSGYEASYESAELQNGQFTHAVLRALTGEADDNRDDRIDTHELRRFVARAVAEATDGAQNPRVDRDNLAQEIVLPVVAR